MLGEPLERARFDRDGIPGDRGFGVVDEQSGRVISAKREAALLTLRASMRPGGPVIYFPDGRALYAEDAADALTELLGRRVRVERAHGDARPQIENEIGVFRGRAGGGFFDSSPVHLVTTSTLAHLSSLEPSSLFDPRRFRPNIVVETDQTGEVERGWLGETLFARDVRFELSKECERCVITTHAQSELPKDRKVLETTARQTDNVVGIYAAVRAPGAIEVGDELSKERRR